MSHELRTPMNAIIGYSEMLIEEVEEAGDSTYLLDLQKIRTAGKHLLALINDVLDFSKIEAGKMDLYLEKFEISSMLQDVVSTINAVGRKKWQPTRISERGGSGVNSGRPHQSASGFAQSAQQRVQVYEQRRYHADGDTRERLWRRLASVWRQRYRDRNFVGTNDKAL